MPACRNVAVAKSGLKRSGSPATDAVLTRKKVFPSRTDRVSKRIPGAGILLETRRPLPETDAPCVTSLRRRRLWKTSPTGNERNCDDIFRETRQLGSLRAEDLEHDRATSRTVRRRHRRIEFDICVACAARLHLKCRLNQSTIFYDLPVVLRVRHFRARMCCKRDACVAVNAPPGPCRVPLTLEGEMPCPTRKSSSICSAP